MKRIIAALAAMIMIMACGYGYADSGNAAEERSATDVAGEYAFAQAEKLYTMVHEDAYIKTYQYMNASQTEYEIMSDVDLKNPYAMRTLSIAKEDLDLLHAYKLAGFDVDEELALAAQSNLYILPVRRMRERVSLYWALLSEFMSINDSVQMPEVDGLIYVVQYFSEGDPIVVTAIMTTEYPQVITHTEFVYLANSVNGVQTPETELFYNFASQFGDAFELETVVFDQE